MSSRERYNISRLAIAFPGITILFWIAVSVAGFFAFQTLRYSLLPDITFPVVVVQAGAPISSAAETVEKISAPLEGRLKTLENVTDVRSSVRPGRAMLTLEFRVGTKLEECEAEVRNALKDLPLPAGSEFQVIPINLNQTSVASYAISCPGKSLEETEQMARTEIVPALLKEPGVLQAELLGKPLSLAMMDPSSQQAPTIVRLNGEAVLGLDVIKRSDANTLEVVKGVKEGVARLQATLPGVQIVLARTQADYIRDATHSTVEALLIAVALSVLVIYPFLRSWSATLISALAIPTSLLGTAIVMAACGFELDTITLLALALVIGIIIDDAIVDVENIARHLEEGSESPRHAALSATKEIGLTVTAATLTIVAVFLPVGLMHGTVGQFFKPFGVTVSAAVVISLLVARTLSPLLAVYWLKPKRSAHKEAGQGAFMRLYQKALEWSVTHRWMVVGIAFASFVAGLALIPLVPKGLMPRLDRGELKIGITLSPSAEQDPNPFAATILAADQIEKFVKASPDVEALYTVIGSRDGNFRKALVYVRLLAGRKLHTAEIADKLRENLPKIAGVTTSVEDIPFVELGDQKPINVALISDGTESPLPAAAALAKRLREMPGFADVTSSESGEGADQHIERVGSRETAWVGANLSGDLSLGDATETVIKLAGETLPTGVKLRLGGDSENAGRVFDAFGVTLSLSVICILGVLLLLFRNWVDPIVIILSLPLAVVGAVFALLVVRSEFGMISLLGVVFLFGLVNKNAILLVDCVNQLRASGLGSVEAMLRAGPMRLRPILMTTLATILGMMPVAIGLGAGAELRAPMAIAIIGGLVTSTLLSLIVVPVVYLVLDPWRGRGKKRAESA